MKRTHFSSSLPKQVTFFKSITERGIILFDIITALFILLFLYTAINKFIAIKDLKIVLKDYPLIGGLSEVIAWALPITEIAISALLFTPRTKLLGLYCSLILMSLFTLYLVYMLIYAPKLPCTCGGMLRKLSWSQHLIFNSIFILLAIIGIRINNNNRIKKKL